MEKQKCIKCYHEWTKRVQDPEQCPKCKRYDWKLVEVKEEVRDAF